MMLHFGIKNMLKRSNKLFEFVKASFKKTKKLYFFSESQKITYSEWVVFFLVLSIFLIHIVCSLSEQAIYRKYILNPQNPKKVVQKTF
jgi:preprotein translocase subunit SecE